VLIIIEGADKTGKTTLAKRLCERLKYDYAHFGAPGKNPAQEYANFLQTIERPVVCDRFLYGEQVYGPLLRGKTLITELQLKTLERLSRSKGAILIHACTPYLTVSERLKRDGDNMITPEQNYHAYFDFERIISKANIPILKYQAANSNSADDFIDEVRSVIEAARLQAITASTVCTGIGTILGPKIVFVGEKLNDKVTWLGLPFDNGSSSQYLLECMRKANIDEKQVYLVNANTLTSEEVLFLRFNGCARFIALGNVASRRLLELGVIHAGLPHPQYWKRFKSNDKAAYIEAFKQGIICKLY
jgi:thymidylate kinase